MAGAEMGRDREVFIAMLLEAGIRRIDIGAGDVIAFLGK